MPAGGVLEIDEACFAASFPTDPVLVRHCLAQHPLLSPAALAALAEALDEHELGRAETPPVAPGEERADFDVDLPTLVRDVGRHRARVTLRHVEKVAAYAELLDMTLSGAAPLIERLDGSIQVVSGFMFLSAPRAVTPVHCDLEHNFLLQLRGTKHVHLGVRDEPGVQQAIERQVEGGNRNLDALPDRHETFVLTPGVGLYVPPEAPHWVENGSEQSASLALNFYTRRNIRAERVHDCNRRLRRLGLTPSPPGRHSVRDRAKATAVRVVPATKQGFTAVRSFLF